MLLRMAIVIFRHSVLVEIQYTIYVKLLEAWGIFQECSAYKHFLRDFSRRNNKTYCFKTHEETSYTVLALPAFTPQPLQQT